MSIGKGATSTTPVLSGPTASLPDDDGDSLRCVVVSKIIGTPTVVESTIITSEAVESTISC